MNRMLTIMWSAMAVLLMFMISITDSHAMSFKHVQDIYFKIAKANGMQVVPRLILKKDPSVNAEAFGYQISVNTGMLNNVRNDSEMAMVLGHELAHGRLGHASSTPANEYAADNLGAKYMKNAGYSVCTGAYLLKRFGSKGSSTHPAGTDRFRKLGCS